MDFTMKTGIKLAITLFSLVAIAHLLRLLYATPITVSNWDVPQWISLLGVVVPAGIAWMLWRESK